MGLYVSNRFFGGLIIRGEMIIYKTLAFFLYLSSIVFPVIWAILFFFGTDHVYL